jgi:PhnB protein
MTKDQSAVSLPQGYGTLTPWLISKDSAKMIAFLEQAFAAQEIPGSRMYNQDGSIGHVEVKIGTSIIMLFDSHPSWPATPAFFRLYLEDIEKPYQQALKAGAQSVTESTELFWGDRVARVRDPFGNIWWLQTYGSSLSGEEMESRMHNPAMIEAMQYVQHSLFDALNSNT